MASANNLQIILIILIININKSQALRSSTQHPRKRRNIIFRTTVGLSYYWRWHQEHQENPARIFKLQAGHTMETPSKELIYIYMVWGDMTRKETTCIHHRWNAAQTLSSYVWLTRQVWSTITSYEISQISQKLLGEQFNTWGYIS